MKKTIIVAFVVAAGAYGAYELANHAEEARAESMPYAWLENDSVDAVTSRLRADFSLSRAEILQQIKEKYP